jgi:hypothetical protein
MAARASSVHTRPDTKMAVRSVVTDFHTAGHAVARGASSDGKVKAWAEATRAATVKDF